MVEGPLPGAALVGWLTIVGTMIALVLLVRSDEPVAVKILGVGLAVAGICVILVYYLGKWRERKRLAQQIRTLERERDRHRSGGGPDS